MATFNEFMQDYVNKSYDELLAFANLSMADLTGELVSLLGDKESATRAYMVVTAACLGVDGKLTTLEYTFLKDLLGLDMSYGDVKGLVEELGGSDAMELTDRLADSLSAQGKAAFLTFCLSFLAVDESISREEVAFVKQLMA